jgi:nitroreductase
MDVKEAITFRRAYRSLTPLEVQRDLLEDLAHSASMAPSCFNKQPWRLVFIFDPSVLNQIYTTLSSGNEWARASNLIIAIFSERQLDCIIGQREYFLFDTGMATAFLILRATELGLVAHPIAGFAEDKVKTILGIPNEYQVITLLIVGRKSADLNPLLSEHQIKAEKERPPRQPLENFTYFNHFSKH